MKLKGIGLFNFILMHKGHKNVQNNHNFFSFIESTQRKNYSTKKSLQSCENSNSVSNQNSANKEDFRDILIKWAVQNNITQQSFSKLLNILSDQGIENLPKNSRELLTARADRIITSQVPPGTYTHLGLKENLGSLMESLVSKNLFNKSEIGVSIFIDNLPLVRFTGQGLWVILGSVEGFSNNIFFVGAYHGYSRPNNSNLFLSKFVEEAKNLSADGLKIGDKNYDVRIKRLICDAPAKSFVLNIKDFNAYSSCTKCNVVGEYRCKKLSFLEKGAPRTDKDYEKEEMYNKGKTNLLEIPNFGVVSNVTIDYMHLVCLGIVKKLLSIWLSDKKHWTEKNSTSQLVKNLALTWPCELQPKLHPFSIFTRWTAKESRNFLLYVGPVLLKDNLKEEYYQHFLLLHVACRLLCTESSPENVDRGRNCLNSFIDYYKKLYSAEQITHNFHGLYHLADECISHGTLDSFSSFPFEQFLVKLRNMMKKCKKRMIPPQILMKESYDKVFTGSLAKLTSHNYKLHKKIKSSDDEFGKNYSIYEKLSYKNFEIIPNGNGDKYVLLKNGEIIEVTNILEKTEKSSKTHFIAGKAYTSVLNFYPNVFQRFPLDIFVVGDLSDANDVWPVDMIDKKCMKAPVGEEKIVMIGLLNENFQ